MQTMRPSTAVAALRAGVGPAGVREAGRPLTRVCARGASPAPSPVTEKARPVSQERFTRLTTRAFAFVVQSKVIPCLILISLCGKWYVFHQFIWGITFQTIMPRIVSVHWNLLSSFKLKVRPLQIKGGCSSHLSVCTAPRGTVAAPPLTHLLSFLCSSSFRSFIKNNRNSCSFNFYNNNMLENSLKRYRQYIFYFQTTDPRGLSSGY